MNSLMHWWRMPSLALLACGTLAAACGGSESETPRPSNSKIVIAACEAPHIALPDGSCIRPGVPPEGCGEGFEHDGEYGCDAILPPDACSPGMMAVPGDRSCRTIMPCGQGRWGDLPVDATTQYVDGSYATGKSDGSSARPWRTVGDAYAAAASGALIAVAAGRYAERLELSQKPVRLWGVCPEKVSIVGQGGGSTVNLGSGADGAEIGGLAITSAGVGVSISGAADVSLDRVWIHDTASAAVAILASAASTSAQLKSSLIESANTVGIYAQGGDLQLSASVIRRTLPRSADQMLGHGIIVRMDCGNDGCDGPSRPTALIEGSRIEDNHGGGVTIEGADLTMTASVVRGTLPQQADQNEGRGIGVQLACDLQNRCYEAHPGKAKIVASIVEDNHSAGIYVSGGLLELDSTMVRNTQPRARDRAAGMGLVLQPACTLAGCNDAAASTGIIRFALFEANHAAAIAASGCKATIEHTVARGTLPQQNDLRLGLGIGIQPACNEQLNCNLAERGELTVLESLIEDNYDAGISVIASDATLSGSVVRGTLPRLANNTFGDGVVVTGQTYEADVTIDTLLIEENARAGLANFGSTVRLAGSTISCAAFELVGQAVDSLPYTFKDDGGNLCGCPDATNACKAVSANLEPPKLLQ